MGVSWGRAFKAAIMVVLYSILWIIVGGVIIAVSVGGAILRSPSLFSLTPAASIGASVGVIIGLLVITFGTYASSLKVMTDLIAEQVEERLKPPEEREVTL